MSPPFSGPRLPLSPASPPDSGLKHDLIISRPAVTPQTPPSPALSGMSVATKRYVSSYENNRHTDELADRSTPDMYSRPHPNPTSSASQTPNALKRHLSHDDEERPMGKRQKKAADEPGSDIELDDSFAATNHDRESGSNGAVSIDVSDKAVSQEENDMLGIKQAILEPTGKAFLVGKSSKARPPPLPVRKSFELMLMLFLSSRSSPHRRESAPAWRFWSTSIASYRRAYGAISSI